MSLPSTNGGDLRFHLVERKRSGLSGTVTLRHTGMSSDIEISVVPEVLCWRLNHLRSLWREADWPKDEYSDSALPVIDPDLIGPGDLRTPLPGNTAFDLWKNRREWVDQQISEFESITDGGGNPTRSRSDNLLRALSETFQYDGVANLQAWPGAMRTNLGDLDDLSRRLAIDDGSEGALLHIETDLHLTAVSFSRLMEIRTIDQAHGSDPALKPVTDEEWNEFISILVQVRKRTSFDAWIQEEHGQIEFGTRDFHVVISEPVPGPWPPAMDPLIDPDELDAKTVKRSLAYSKITGLWEARRTQLQSIQQGRQAYREVNDYDQLLHDSLKGSLATIAGSAAVTNQEALDMLEGFQTKLADPDPQVARAAETTIREQLFFSRDDFAHIMEVKRKVDDPNNAPTDEEWTRVYAILTQHKKRQDLYSVWSIEERTHTIHYWDVFDLRLAPWRATATDRFTWVDALQSRSQLPLVDPDIISPVDLRDDLHGRAYDLWSARRQGIIDLLESLTNTVNAAVDKLQAFDSILTEGIYDSDSRDLITAWIKSERGAHGLAMLLEWTFGRSLADLKAVQTNLASADPVELGEATSITRNELFLPVDAFKWLMVLKDDIDGGAVPTVARWNRAEATLSKAVQVGTVMRLERERTDGYNIEPRLKQLGLSPAEFNYLVRIRAILSAGNEALETEWTNIRSILVQAQKRKLYTQWRLEEMAPVAELLGEPLVLGPDAFRIDDEGGFFPWSWEDDPSNIWRAPRRDLRDWREKLVGRIQQQESIRAEFVDSVDSVEKPTLPELRAALIDLVSDAQDEQDEAAAKLSNRFALSFAVGGCEKTTRVSQAVKTLQTLLWGIRQGALIEPSLQLVAPAFDDEWQWIGSYPSWRGAMFAFLYPENLLLPSLRRPDRQTPMFRDLVRTLRTRKRLNRKSACIEAKSYSEYFRDVSNLKVEATCEAWARVRSGDCSNGVNDRERVKTFFMFGLARDKAYWSVSTPSESGSVDQTYWKEIPGLESDVRKIIGAVPFEVSESERYIYLFVKQRQGASNRLVYHRYDLDYDLDEDWLDGDLEPLELPDALGEVKDFTCLVDQSGFTPPRLLVAAKSDASKYFKCSVIRLAADGNGLNIDETLPLASPISGGHPDSHFLTNWNPLGPAEWPDPPFAFHSLSEDRLVIIGYTVGVYGWITVGDTINLNFIGSFQPLPTIAAHLYHRAPRYKLAKSESWDLAEPASWDVELTGDVEWSHLVASDSNGEPLTLTPVGIKKDEISFISSSPLLLSGGASNLDDYPDWLFSVSTTGLRPHVLAAWSLYSETFCTDIFISAFPHNSFHALKRTSDLRFRRVATPVISPPHEADDFTTRIAHWDNASLGFYEADLKIKVFHGISQGHSRRITPKLNVPVTQSSVGYPITVSGVSTYPYVIEPVSDMYEISEKLSVEDAQWRRQLMPEQFAINSSDESRTNQTYLEEAYYFVPMQLAAQLVENGEFATALDWYRTVYDYTKADPERVIYSPLNSERSLSSVFDRAEDWLGDPMNPHAIASTRAFSYTRYTLLAIIQCLLKYADAEFTRDTDKSVARAERLYERALGLLTLEELNPKFGQCEELIGRINLSAGGPVERILIRALRSSAAQIRDPVVLETTVNNINNDLRDTSKPLPIRLIRTGTRLAKVIAEQPPVRSVELVLGNETRESAKVYDRLLQNPDVETAVRHIQVGTTAFLTTAVSQVTGFSENQLLKEKKALPWLRTFGYATGSGAHSTGNGNATVSNDDSMARAVYALLAPSFVPQINRKFCIPPNPVVATFWLQTTLSLYKIRNCRNISGMRRELDPYEAPVDTTTGVAFIGAGGTLPLPRTPRLSPTPYRYDALVERAKILVGLAQQMESAFLSALEKRDAAAYNLLKARQDQRLARGTVRLQDLRVKAAKDGVELAKLQQERAHLQSEAYETWLAAELNVYEVELLETYKKIAISRIVQTSLMTALENANWAVQVAQIPSIPGQIAAGALLGGTLGTKLGFSIDIVQKERAISQFTLMASHERRKQEWELQKNLADQDIAITGQQIRLAHDDVRIVGQERRIAQIQSENAEDMVEFLGNKFANEELYDWMSGILEGVYDFFLQQATSTAQLAEAQLTFERREIPPVIIKEDYWEAPPDSAGVLSGEGEGEGDSADRRGMTGSARLLKDIFQLDQFAFESRKRKEILSKTFSLAQLAPVEFAEFRNSGIFQFWTPMEIFDRELPGNYHRLVQRVNITVLALIPALQGIRATLSSSGISRLVVGEDIFQTVEIRRPPESLTLTSPTGASGTLELQADQAAELLYPFEGMGVDASWEFRLPRAANQFDFGTIFDVLFALEYTALNSSVYYKQVIERLDRRFSGDRPYSFRNDFPDQWYHLHNPSQTNDPMSVRFTTARSDFPPNLDHLNILNVILYISGPVEVVDSMPITLTFTEDGRAGSIGGEATPINQIINTLKGNGGGWNLIKNRAPFGKWELVLPDTAETRSLFQRDLIDDILFVITYSGDTPEWPH